MNSKDFYTKLKLHGKYKDKRNILSTFLKRGKMNYLNKYFETNLEQHQKHWKNQINYKR